MLQKGFPKSGFILLWFPGQPWLLEDRDGLERARVPELWPAVAGMLWPQPSGCLSWHRAADVIPSRCHWGHGPAEGDPQVPAAGAGRSQGMLAGRGGMWGTPLSCSFALPPSLGYARLRLGTRAGLLRGTMDQRALVPHPGEVSADPRPISPFQVSFTFESP